MKNKRIEFIDVVFVLRTQMTGMWAMLQKIEKEEFDKITISQVTYFRKNLDKINELIDRIKNRDNNDLVLVREVFVGLNATLGATLDEPEHRAPLSMSQAVEEFERLVEEGLKYTDGWNDEKTKKE